MIQLRRQAQLGLTGFLPERHLEDGLDPGVPVDGDVQLGSVELELRPQDAVGLQRHRIARELRPQRHPLGRHGPLVVERQRHGARSAGRELDADRRGGRLGALAVLRAPLSARAKGVLHQVVAHHVAVRGHVHALSSHAEVRGDPLVEGATVDGTAAHASVLEVPGPGPPVHVDVQEALVGLAVRAQTELELRDGEASEEGLVDPPVHAGLGGIDSGEAQGGLVGDLREPRVGSFPAVRQHVRPQPEGMDDRQVRRQLLVDVAPEAVVGVEHHQPLEVAGGLFVGTGIDHGAGIGRRLGDGIVTGLVRGRWRRWGCSGLRRGRGRRRANTPRGRRRRWGVAPIAPRRVRLEGGKQRGGNSRRRRRRCCCGFGSAGSHDECSSPFYLAFAMVKM
mmetsp:Transcript_26129/g.61371  ORF Transcript_26129/g.61371 Transcript_26129/m.61371 type:complete len:393 (-) Transcript_26129:263-1441(-)